MGSASSAAAAIHEFTTVVAVDKSHLEELRVAWPTWRAFRPEIMASPLLVMFDARELSQSQLDFIRLQHENVQLVACSANDNWPQRERMLSLFVKNAPHRVKSPYFLKLDVDCIATGPGSWIQPWWFDGSPVFVSSGWPYSKPADTVQRLDDWGDTVDGLRKFPRLNLFYDPASSLIRHRRIISYCYFGRTDWHRAIANMAPDRLPVPSQDGYCWYCAERTRQFYRTIKMSKFGWRHVNGLARLRAAASDVLAGVQEAGAA